MIKAIIFSLSCIITVQVFAGDFLVDNSFMEDMLERRSIKMKLALCGKEMLDDETCEKTIQKALSMGMTPETIERALSSDILKYSKVKEINGDQLSAL